MNKKYEINEKEIPTGQPDAKRSIYVAEQAIPVGNNGDIENPNPQAQNAELQGIPIKSQGASPYGQNVITADQGPDFIDDPGQLTHPVPYECKYCHHSGITRMNVVATKEKKLVIIFLIIFLCCCLIPFMKHLDRYEHYCTNCDKCIMYYQIMGHD
ncbi:unnamed protein product [Moneuplotes crassus]|uniref:LITAF domain-containing protein n=1 Tax=Euplotes crassus TaxID=5936 RepID=A0AAD1XZV8_EUPCR|nr:unnamed protein product [Moneuplotes crassus]